jgi:hypothetical protein
VTLYSLISIMPGTVMNTGLGSVVKRHDLDLEAVEGAEIIRDTYRAAS